jgi:signal transduction histidine kinase/CheY-like chemotaxis protein
MASRWWRDRLGPIFAGLALAATAGTTPVARQLDLWLGDSAARVTAPDRVDGVAASTVFDIDDRSLDRLTPLVGPWPFGRDVWAQVVDYLHAQGARRVVLDVLFADPRPGDARLGAALGRARGSIVAAATVPFTIADTTAASLAGLGWRVPANAPAMVWADVRAPRPELRRSAGVGVATAVPDPDGVVRRVPLLHRTGRATLPAIGLAAALPPEPPEGVDVGWTPGLSGGTLRIGSHALPVDAQGSVELWYPQSLAGFSTVRFDRLAQAALTTTPDPELARLVRDRQIFVGASAFTLDQTIQTPRGRIAGVEFARLSAALLADRQVLRPAVWPWDLLLFVLAFAVPFAIDAARRDAPARLVAALPLAWLAIGAAALLLLLAAGQRTALVTPLVAALGATVALGMQEIVRLRRERLALMAERLAAERATELKTRVLNHIAHELRTPLSAILGFGRLLGHDGGAPADRRDYAQVIVRNSTHLLRLVNNLLDDARLAAGHAVSEPQPGSVRQVVRDVVATVDGLPRHGDVEVLARVDDGVPDRLMIDELRIRQIVLNLVANAAKFTERGHIRIDVTWTADRLEIGVEDTGPGIEPEARERIFEEFEYGSPAAARAGGSGLGLNVSRRLARLMGGDLVLASTAVGRGTRFVLTVPARAVPEVARPAPAATPRPAPPVAAREAAPVVVPSAMSGDWKPVILVCDDSPDIRQLMTVVLERAGAEPALAPTGEDAVALFAQRRPDAVLLDLDLPGMSGFEVADRLRAEGFTGPVIAVTGGGDDLSGPLRDHRFTGVIHKPTPGSAVVDKLAAQLPRWQPRRHRTGQPR